MYILILFIIMLIFILIGLFLLIYSFIGKEKIKLVPKDKNINPCIIIPARDESKVIENLLISITNQTVKIPSENVYIVVESLNDKTCEIAKKYSMNIVLRKNLSLRRKSYAIDDAIKEIMAKKKKYDLYFIFDADNVLDKNYMKHMLESYKKGYQVATGYRNTKNGNSSVVAAASSLTFTMVNTLFNRKKKKKNYAMTVSGTGFYISGEIIEDLKGYPFNSLTEDYEFSLYMVINNISSTYNEDAIFYDEQPTSYEVSKKQRTRWARGYLDTRIKYLNEIREKMYDKDTKNKKAITRAEMEEAAIKVVAGPEKKSRVVTPAEKRLTAYHEGGHAICTYFCPTQDKVHHVTIIPRGQAGGFTMSIPEKDKSYVSKNEMFENIIVLLGGRVAEKLILDDISTGASNDLERATATARNMVTRYGFSDNLGPVVYGRGEHEVFLGRDYSSTPSYSENVAAEIDNEIRSIVEDAYNDCEKLLREHRDKLELIAHYLMKHEKIDGSNFEKLMKGELDPSEFMDYDVQAAYDQKMTELMGDAYKPADKTDEDENANNDSTAE